MGYDSLLIGYVEIKHTSVSVLIGCVMSLV